MASCTNPQTPSPDGADNDDTKPSNGTKIPESDAVPIVEEPKDDPKPNIEELSTTYLYRTPEGKVREIPICKVTPIITLPEDDNQLTVYEAKSQDKTRDGTNNSARVSPCSECEESDDEDDLCSTTSEESGDESNIPPASHAQPPLLPDVQLRVPMENEEDVRKVRAALQVKGVLEVACNLQRQTVTVTGNVPAARLLKKVRKVKRQSRILSYRSPLGMPPHAPPTPAPHHDAHSMPSSTFYNPPSHQFPYDRRPQPTYQTYTFHNNPHSPYLRTYSPPDWSPPASPPHYYTGDSFNPSYHGYQGGSHQTSYYADSNYHPNRTAGTYYY
jgi:hypothetical protein